MNLPNIPLPGGGPMAAPPDIMRVTARDPWDVAADFFEPPPPYATDLKLWGQDRLGEFYWSKQEEIGNSLQTERYTAVKSCHDAGKSFIAARAIAHWIDTHPEGEAFVVSTAPTNAQVAAILWREIGRAHKRAAEIVAANQKGKPMVGRIVSAGYPQWKLSDGELVGYGRKPADYSQSAFQGIHARYVLIVLDEACGIDRALFDSVDALATNENARVLAIGNPDDPGSHFAEVCKPDSGWNVIRIDGLRTPNFTREAVEWLDCRQCQKAGNTKTLLQRLFEEEGITYTNEVVPDALRPMLLSPLWVEERLHRWVGRVEGNRQISELAAQSSLFTSKVRGLFPDSNTEGVIPLGWVERAMDRGRELANSGEVPVGRKVLGVDVADEGEDETTIAIRRGASIMEIRSYPNGDTMETTGRVVMALDEAHAFAVVDVIGVGAGVVARLREQKQKVSAFNAAKSAADKRDQTGEFKFTTMRSWAWWHLRELLDPSNGFNITLPDDEMLKADLTAPRWSVLSGGRIQIESKKDIRKRLGRSTDKGDAVLMAFTTDSFVPSTSPDGDDGVSWWGTPEQRPETGDAAVDNLQFDGAVELDRWLSDADTMGDPNSWQ